MNLQFFIRLIAFLKIVNAVPPPGKVLDLSTFDALQIPVDNGKGGMTQIKHPELDTYSSEFFYTNPYDDSEVVFWAPENGSGISENGSGPRTELTEKNNLFTFSGTHTMSYDITVKEVPSDGQVCIGQIKGDSCDSCRQQELFGNETLSSLHGSCKIVVELIYDADNSGLVTAHMRSKSGNSCSSENFKLGKFDMGEKIHIDMKVDGYYVYVSSNKVQLDKYDYSFWKGSHYGMHFKVGLYDQTSCKSCSSGAKAKLSNLKIKHSN